MLMDRFDFVIYRQIYVGVNIDNISQSQMKLLIYHLVL